VPTFRETPYGVFNYLVSLGGPQGGGDLGNIIGGFADVSSFGLQVEYKEYRNGNEQVNGVRKVPTTHTVDDVTLKRGVIGSEDLFAWVKEARDGVIDKRTIRITLLDEARNEVATWTLRDAQPKKWVGPALTAKGGEVAVEELHLVYEGIEYG
jgi:phage tail-like protein